MELRAGLLYFHCRHLHILNVPLDQGSVAGVYGTGEGRWVTDHTLRIDTRVTIGRMGKQKGLRACPTLLTTSNNVREAAEIAGHSKEEIENLVGQEFQTIIELLALDEPV
jgi:hypothetical protein